MARSLVSNYDNRTRRVVAEFRADVSAHISGSPVVQLVDELATRSELFRRYWHERVVLEREGGERGFNHPKDGYLCFEQVGFVLSGRPDLKLVILLSRHL